MAPELVAGGGNGGLIREKPHCGVGGGTANIPSLRRDGGRRGWMST